MRENDWSLGGLKILVVVPAFNEANHIVSVLQELNSFGYSHVVVNDHSRDSTSEVVENYGSNIIDLPFNLGVGGALRTGFRYALENGFNTVIQIDADGQHPIKEIVDLISKAEETSADMVIGSRFLGDELFMKVALSRRLAMKVLSFTASNATGVRITDSTSGFRLITGKLLQELSIHLPVTYLGDTFESVVAAGQAGYKVCEIPASIGERTSGESSASTLSAFKFTLKCFFVSALALYPRLGAKLDRTT